MARYPLSEWGCIIDGAQDRREKLFEVITKNIEKRDPPSTQWKFEEVKTKGLTLVPFFGKKREFLVVKNEAKGMGDYSIDICADPYGNTLPVHVGLCVFALGKGGLQDWQEKKVSWEDQTVLSDWSSVIFTSVQEACRELTKELGQDPNKLKSDTRGILSVW